MPEETMQEHSTHRARKRFGQNFLHDAGIIRRIVQAINPHIDDNMVEIGPGLGALTRQLLPRLAALHVIEIDNDLVRGLHESPPAGGALHIHHGDVLRFDFAGLPHTRPLRIVGNLPYNISTPLLFHLFNFASHIDDMHFMLQNEVVDRLSATPHSHDYGRLSVMAQYRADITKLFVVPPGCFRPAPKVDSAIVRLRLRPPQQVATSEKGFAELVRLAFAQRRKTLRNTLKGAVSSEQIEACGIDPSARAETLAVDDFVRLANSVTIPDAT